MLALSTNLRYYLCRAPADMRQGFDALAGTVRNVLNRDPLGGAVFIFLNKNRTHIKLLYWDGDGFALFYKRLERGRFDDLSVGNTPDTELNRRALTMLFEGFKKIEIKQKIRYKKE